MDFQEKKENKQSQGEKGNQQESEIKKLLKELEEQKIVKEKYLAYAQRCRADFLNYKKEEAERIKNFIDWQKAEWLLELLPLLDDFQQAKKEISKDFKNLPLVEGFLRIEKGLKDFFKKQGIEELDAQVGKRFDPHFQEAVESVEYNEAEEGTITEVVQKGYKFKDKVIRPVRVKVSRKKSNETMKQ